MTHSQPLPKFLYRFLSLFWRVGPEGHVISEEERNRLDALLASVALYRSEEASSVPDSGFKRFLRDSIDASIAGSGCHVRTK